MRKDLHPLVMIGLVAAVTLAGRALPTWTLSLATIAASNALIANAWGLTDAVAQVIVGAACGGLLGLVIGP